MPNPSCPGAKRNPKPVAITEYALPGAIDWLAIGGMLTLYGAGVASPYIVPGSKLWALLEDHVPGGAGRVLWIARNIVPWLALVHALESVLFDQLRMRKYGVPRWSLLWWKWELSCFIEGIGVWRRIGSVISRLESQSLKRNK